MKGIIFDLDGVLVDSMPTHYKAWNIAFEEITSLQVDEKSIYLLEGMRGEDIVKQIFKKYSFGDLSKTNDVVSRKDEIFRSVMNIKPYDKVNEILEQLTQRESLVGQQSRMSFQSLTDVCRRKSSISFSPEMILHKENQIQRVSSYSLTEQN